MMIDFYAILMFGFIFFFFFFMIIGYRAKMKELDEEANIIFKRWLRQFDNRRKD